MRRFFVTVLAFAPAIAVAQGSLPLDSPPPARAQAGVELLVEPQVATDSAPQGATDSAPQGATDSASQDATDSASQDATASAAVLPRTTFEPSVPGTVPGSTATAIMSEPESVGYQPESVGYEPESVDSESKSVDSESHADPETWSVDHEFVHDEVAAFEDADPFRPSGTVDQADELFKTASVQIETYEYRDAERAVTDGIDIVEQQVGRYDPILVDPLTLLGDSRFGQGDFGGALDAYERAIHVTRVNDGLHSAQQVEIIYKEADTLAALGDLEKANDRHEYAYEMLHRNYGPNSIELVPGMYKLAHWYTRNHDVFSARGLYQYAARALNAAYGSDDLRLIPALQGIAGTYKAERFPPYRAPEGPTLSMSSGTMPSAARSQARPSVNRFAEGERALQQIVRIQEANPEATVGDIAVAILDLADWNLMFEKWDRAYTLYEFSYRVLSEQGGIDTEDVADYFAEPRPLYLPLPHDPSPPGNLSVVPTPGYVELSYTVTDRGAVHHLETTISKPEGLMDFKVRRAMRAARFRPQLVDGQAISTPNLVYRHRFEYFPVQVTPSEAQQEQEQPQDPDATESAAAVDTEATPPG